MDQKKFPLKAKRASQIHIIFRLKHNTLTSDRIFVDKEQLIFCTTTLSKPKLLI